MTNRHVLIWVGACLMISVVGAVQHYVDGDIDILVNGTYWKCDRIICPPVTYKCQVIVKPQSKTLLSRRNVCFDRSGAVLSQSENTLPMLPNERKYLKVEAFANGITTSSHSSVYASNYYSSGGSNSYSVNGATGNYDPKQAEEIERQVQQQVQTINTDLEQQMSQLRNMFSGGFFGRR